MAHNVCLKLDELLKARGFRRDYYHGGPINEPAFAHAVERGIRFYVNPRTGTSVLTHDESGVWHLHLDGSPRPVARGCGVAQLVRALRRLDHRYTTEGGERDERLRTTD